MKSSFSTTDADESVLEHLNDMVSIVDKHYVYRAVSKGYSSLFGKSIGEIVGSTVVELYGEDVFHKALKLPPCSLTYQAALEFPLIGFTVMKSALLAALAMHVASARCCSVAIARAWPTVVLTTSTTKQTGSVNPDGDIA